MRHRPLERLDDISTDLCDFGGEMLERFGDGDASANDMQFALAAGMAMVNRGLLIEAERQRLLYGEPVSRQEKAARGASSQAA